MTRQSTINLGSRVAVATGGDGIADTTAAIEAALAAMPATGGELFFPPGSYRHGPIVVDKPCKIVYAGGAKSIPVFDTSTLEKLWDLQSPDIVIDGFTVEGLAGTVSANKYLIYANPGADRVQVLRANISNVTMSDGNVGLTNLLVTHGIYIDGADGCIIERSRINVISGAAVFVKSATALRISDNHFTDTRWYSINLDHTCEDVTIENNRIDGDDTNTRYWGGSINLMSQTTGAKNKRVRVAGNTITGVHNYGAVLRVLSIEDCTIEGNNLYDCVPGGIVVDQDVQYIAIDRRGIAVGQPENGPCRNVAVIGNILRAGTGEHLAIYIKNQYIATRDPHEQIAIVGNTILSPNATDTFQIGISLHGFQAGIDGLIAADNLFRVLTVVGSPVGGAVGFVSTDANGLIDNVFIDNNQIVDINTAVPSASSQIGIFFLGHCANVRCRGNLIQNFFYGVRTGASNLTNIRDLNNQHFEGNLNDTLFATPPDGDMDVSIGTVLPVTGVYAIGHVRQKTNAAASTSWGWVATTAGGAMTSAWASGQNYVAGTWYRNASNRVYELITAGGGTTAGEPTGVVIGVDETAADGYTWRCRAVASARWAPMAALGAVEALP